MIAIEQFIKNNQEFASKYSAAIKQLSYVVDGYPTENLKNLDFSVHALSEIFKNKFISKREIPLLIEALCNLEPHILSRQYWFVDQGEAELIKEDDVVRAVVDGFMPNPFTGEPDDNYKEKVGLRFVLSHEALKYEY